MCRLQARGDMPLHGGRGVGSFPAPPGGLARFERARTCHIRCATARAAHLLCRIVLHVGVGGEPCEVRFQPASTLMWDHRRFCKPQVHIDLAMKTISIPRNLMARCAWVRAPA